MSEPDASYKIVVHEPGEKAREAFSLIISSWIRTLRTGNDMFRLMEPEGYYSAMSMILPPLLARNSIRLAVLTDTPDVVLGYAVYHGKTLDYWYVKKDLRGMGIGRSLLPEFDTVSAITKTWLLIWAKEPYKAIKFNPFK